MGQPLQKITNVFGNFAAAHLEPAVSRNVVIFAGFYGTPLLISGEKHLNLAARHQNLFRSVRIKDKFAREIDAKRFFGAVLEYERAALAFAVFKIPYGSLYIHRHT